MKKKRELKAKSAQVRRALRKTEAHDLGKRFTAEQTFFREVLALEDRITPKIDEALYQKEFGKVGDYLRSFYLEICKKLDQTKFELEESLPKD